MATTASKPAGAPTVLAPPRIIGLDEIRAALRDVDLLPGIEAAFVAYSSGRAVVPPVGELLLPDVQADVHIKYGYIAGEPYYVIKIASGFYQNPEKGLPSSNGLMLVFRRATGELAAILLDEGLLTDLRTGAAGAVAAKHLAPKTVRRIGIVGSGTQARHQLRMLKAVTPCRDVVAWGRHPDRLARYRDEMAAEGFTVAITTDVGDVMASCDLVVTATAARAPLLLRDQLRPGMHITALGADSPGKQELDPLILRRADVVVADSISQCLERGEIAHAVRSRCLRPDDVVELGAVIAGTVPGRTSEDDITVADLTGVAVQDIEIARTVLEAVEAREPTPERAGDGP
ncbi:MAG: ornithine cyclodeaminase family protein [Gemmatimonadales bacterium]|jgi:ornithine cyclodeaminase